MIKPEVLDAMVSAGCTAEQIAAAVKADMAGRSSNAERQARFRAKRKENGVTSNVTSVTERNGVSPKKETSPTPPKEKNTPSSSEDKSSSQSVRDFFAEFWLVYPRREGPNPRKPAQERFHRIVAKGSDPEAIITAAKAFANDHPTPTRFVPQAVTWLNQERFADTAPVISGDTFCASEAPATRLHLIRHRNEYGRDPPDAIQGGRTGFLIPTDWVKAMELRQANG